MIREAIKRRHENYSGKPQGLLFFELATGTGFSKGEPNRIDAWHMEDIPSKGLCRTAYEIKESRSDFLREIKTPLKRRAALRVSNQFYFVSPKGMIKPEEIPPECGLLEFTESRLLTSVEAPFRDGEPSSWHFVASIARRAIKSEAVTLNKSAKAGDKNDPNGI